MKKKIISGVVALGILVASVLAVVTATQNHDCGLDNGATFRTAEEINSDKIVYLDEGAIALADSSTDTSIRQIALETFSLINEQRVAAGVKPLSWNPNLEDASMVRAQECAVVFSHQRPNGKAWNTVNSKIQGGENLAFGYQSAQEAVSAWMASPTHADNILYPKFASTSISIYEEGGTFYFAQEFAYPG